MTVEWTITIEGKNEFRDVCRKAVRIDKSWERLFDGDVGLSIEDGKTQHLSDWRWRKMGWRRREFRLRPYKAQPFAVPVAKGRYEPKATADTVLTEVRIGEQFPGPPFRCRPQTGHSGAATLSLPRETRISAIACTCAQATLSLLGLIKTSADMPRRE